MIGILPTLSSAVPTRLFERRNSASHTMGAIAQELASMGWLTDEHWNGDLQESLLECLSSRVPAMRYFAPMFSLEIGEEGLCGALDTESMPKDAIGSLALGRSQDLELESVVLGRNMMALPHDLLNAVFQALECAPGLEVCGPLWTVNEVREAIWYGSEDETFVMEEEMYDDDTIITRAQLDRAIPKSLQEGKPISRARLLHIAAGKDGVAQIAKILLAFGKPGRQLHYDDLGSREPGRVVVALPDCELTFRLWDGMAEGRSSEGACDYGWGRWISMANLRKTLRDADGVLGLTHKKDALLNALVALG